MKRLFLIALLALTVPAIAYADSMTWTFSAYDTDMHFYIPGQDVHTQLGIFKITITDTAPPTNWPDGGSFLAFCVDLQHYVGNSNSVVLDDMANWKQPYTVTPDFPDYLGAGSYVAYLLNLNGIPGTAQQQAAMQLAIWEILYEDRDLRAFNVYSGQAYASGVNATTMNLANAYLAPINALGTNIPNAHAPWIKTTNDSGSYYQDFTTAVPEPSTLLLLGAGLIAGALSRRKFR